MNPEQSPAEIISAQDRDRRARAGLVIAKYSMWCGLFFMGLASFVGYQSQNPRFYQLLPILLFLVIAAWLYPLLYRRGRSRAGRIVLMLSMLLVVFFLPLTSSGGLIAAAVGAVVFIIFGYQLLGNRGGIGFTILALVSLVGDYALIEFGQITIAESPPFVKILVDPAIMVILTTVIVRAILVEQDKAIFKAQTTELAVERELNAFRDERDRWQHALAEARQTAALERLERERVQTTYDQACTMAGEMNAVEVLAATLEQSSAARDQAEQVRQTSAMMETMWAMVEQSAVHAQTVSTAATRSVEISQSGQLVVQGLIESMGDIKARVETIEQTIHSLAEKTERIGQIITTVTEIANQSNVLALNASIEASRAAEHGEGFGVVAQEMRRMAALSKAATIQIKSILEEVQRATAQTVRTTGESVQGIEEDLRLAAQARASIELLSKVVAEAAQASEQMLEVGRQQMAGVDSVVVAVQTINDTTNQYLTTAQLVEESVRRMDELAHRLAETTQK